MTDWHKIFTYEDGQLYWKKRGPKRNLDKPAGGKSVCTSGYRQIGYNGKLYLAHRIIAEMYIDNPDNLPCVNHIDGNKLNNRVENLEWCTYKQNNQHARDTGLHKFQLKPCQSYCPETKVSKWYPSLYATTEDGHNVGSVHHACEGKYKKHNGLQWSYA